ncbi:SDR family oxidoreductase [Microvirga terricola]|uniref:SDR family oxidoreductase n=1 Tax=Microvirga terricola TaxID=2719797 RepID=A0ABX0VCK4_9HYPH|nr:SDR family oxidoreductase [Microvirga terricola]NIX77579.1 SDR family oxidoreductase [Microvirga terricola]
MKLFIFGLGYSALRFAEAYRQNFAEISGTVRSDDKRGALTSAGIPSFRLDGMHWDPQVKDELLRSDAILVSIPPLAGSDPVLSQFSDVIRSSPRLSWIGYLSTVGVYGDAGGGWVDEGTPPAPINERSSARVVAENGWLDLGRASRASVQIFRLAGIYGPERNALRRVMDGTARRVIKPGQVFNRIHVDDIAQLLMASIRSPARNAIYNVSDDEPAPQQDVISYAAELLGREPPPDEPFAEAKLGAAAESFYQDNKRVLNTRIKRDLGVALKYPTYREGLQALLAAGEGQAG